MTAMQHGFFDRAREILRESCLDAGLGIAVDNAGNTYVTGFTESPNFPVTPGAFQPKLRGRKNAFLAVINTAIAGTAALVYSTYLGGSACDAGFDVAVDSAGNAYITGFTESPDFPVTPGAFQTMLKGCKNAFLAVINTTATGAASLAYSTYLGGSALDVGFGVAVNYIGQAAITGFTTSPDFPVTSGALQAAPKGHKTAFVSVIGTALTGAKALTYSTYLGGSIFDEGHGIAVDPGGNLYVTGFTFSSDFPVTAGAYQSALNSKFGGANVFVSKINTGTTGTRALIYSTYLGGSIYDQGCAIATDASNNVYVAGFTRSPDYPVTSGAFQTSLKSRDGTNAFVSKLNTGANGARSLVYSTYLGGSICDEARGIAADKAGNAYITGFTYSPDFPVTSNTFQAILKTNDTNAFVSQINTSTTGSNSLTYSTYLGGGVTDVGNGIALDKASNIYVTGRTSSHDFPVTTGAFQTRQTEPMNAFLSELNATNTGVAGLVYSTYLG